MDISEGAAGEKLKAYELVPLGNYLIPGVGVRKGDMGGMEVVEGVGGVDVFPSPDITDIMHCEEEGRRKKSIEN